MSDFFLFYFVILYLSVSTVPRNIKSRPKPKKTTEQPPKQQTKIPAKEQTENKTEPEKTEKKKGLSNSDFSKLFSS